MRARLHVNAVAIEKLGQHEASRRDKAQLLDVIEACSCSFFTWVLMKCLIEENGRGAATENFQLIVC